MEKPGNKTEATKETTILHFQKDKYFDSVSMPATARYLRKCTDLRKYKIDEIKNRLILVLPLTISNKRDSEEESFFIVLQYMFYIQMIETRFSLHSQQIRQIQTRQKNATGNDPNRSIKKK